jgi:hypothetical protein
MIISHHIVFFDMLTAKQEVIKMTVADDILDEVSRKAGLTEMEIAALLFGRKNAYQQRVNSTCRRLVNDGKLIRDGKGGANDPFTYRIPPIRRR